MGSGVENCWKRSISSERRVCVGRSQPPWRGSAAARRRASPGQQRAAEFPQEEDKRHLARLIGQLPIPGACRIGAAEGALHLEAQAQRVDLKALRQIGLQRLGHCEDRGGRIRQDRNNDRRQHGRDQRLERHQNTSGWGNWQSRRRSRAAFQLPLPQPASASRISILGRAVVDFVPVMFYI
jgi:hypothetical protein